MSKTSHPVTNSAIRQRAWQLCMRSYPQLMLASFVVAAATAAIQWAGTTISLPNYFLTTLAQILLAPVLSVGLQQYALQLWHGEPAQLSTLFVHMRRPGRIWLIALIIELPTLVSDAAPLFIPGLTVDAMIVYAIVLLVYLVVSLWVILRLGLSLGAAVIFPDMTGMDCIRASWQSSRGKLWRLLAHSFVLSLPIVVLQILANLFLKDIPSYIIGVLPSSLFYGYISLGYIGLAEYLLTGHSPCE